VRVSRCGSGWKRFISLLLWGASGVVPLELGAQEAPRIYTQVPEIVPTSTSTPERVVSSPTPVVLQALAAGPTPEWIWGPNPDSRYVLRTTFSGQAQTAWLQFTADNQATVSINGHEVASSDDWSQSVVVDITSRLRPGENELLAEVTNAGGPAGFVLKLALTDAAGQTRYIVSDSSWQAVRRRDRTSAMAVVSRGKLGIEPWGNPFENVAGDSGPERNVFQTLPGFQVERLFTVPKDELGSWVSITTDDRGRLLVSDQEQKGLCRITPPPLGSREPTRVERLTVPITAAQGLLYAFGSLYVSVNGGPGSGLYRVRDTDGDDQFDEVVKLKDFRGGGEHGPHALRLSPDGQSIYCCAGNHTLPPFDIVRQAGPQTMGGPRAEPLLASVPEGHASRIPVNWDEDLLLPRQWDGNGHARGILAPGGWVARTDPEGKSWELISVGYRNQYDFAFNHEGELFAYDADMEWDMGMPWYRPTRVVHATSGSEFGWRSGTGKWPTYYPDNLPPVVNIGPGSPVGVEFGYRAKFPAKYQQALFILDWTFGTMYAIHLEPDGASYRGVKEEFLSRTPLPLTDAVVGQDGALYFTIGGRGTQSELFRVTYVGEESTAPAAPADDSCRPLRELRRQLEAHHRRMDNPAATIELALQHVGHPDRFIRYAARIALEHQPVELWRDQVLRLSPPEARITGVIALARQGAVADRAAALQALAPLAREASLSEAQRLALLRAYQLVFIRLGTPTEEERQTLLAALDPQFPADSDFVNRELVNLLVFLKSPTVVSKVVGLLQQPSRPTIDDFGAVIQRNRGYGGPIAAMLRNAPDQQQVHYAFALRNARDGWTLADRKAYFEFLDRARRWSGGASFGNFIKNIDNEAFDNATDAERLALEATGARKPFTPPELPKPQGPGRAWAMPEILNAAEQGLKRGRDFKNGQKMFAAARCVLCHRFAGEGGATGPDLTQLAGRFNLKDLTESILDPGKVVSDQYKAVTIATSDGKAFTGKIVSETADTLLLLVNPEDATKVVEIPKSAIEEQSLSPITLMPKDLLNQLNEHEVLDLLAYLLSRGNPSDPMFRK
jgi:putative heme-binding domain-containing protein